MELTEDMLRRIANHIVDLQTQIDSIENVITQMPGVDPQFFERQVQQARESPDYQSICDRLFEQLKGDR